MILSKNVRVQKDAESDYETICPLAFLMEIKIAACRSIFVPKSKFCGAKSFLFLGFRLGVSCLGKVSVSPKTGFFYSSLIRRCAWRLRGRWSHKNKKMTKKMNQKYFFIHFLENQNKNEKNF